ncbi:MAG: hypothetical protein ACYC7L_16805 [Nitrospirota bacterium]
MNKNTEEPHSGQMKYGASLLLVAVIISLIITAYHRNSIYMTYLTMWTDVVKKSMYKARPHNNLGNSFMFVGNNKQAYLEYFTALTFDRNYMVAYDNLFLSCSNLEAARDFKNALDCFNAYSQITPPTFQSHTNARIRAAIIKTRMSEEPEISNDAR